MFIHLAPIWSPWRVRNRKSGSTIPESSLKFPDGGLFMEFITLFSFFFFGKKTNCQQAAQLHSELGYGQTKRSVVRFMYRKLAKLINCPAKPKTGLIWRGGCTKESQFWHHNSILPTEEHVRLITKILQGKGNKIWCQEASVCVCVSQTQRNDCNRCSSMQPDWTFEG